MRKDILSKILVLGVISLFVGLCITSGTGVNVEQTNEQMSRDEELAWWKFDEGSGNTAYDSSGHGFDGLVVGATWVSGGLDFDGTDDYVQFDTHAQALGVNKTDDYFVYVRFQSTGSGMLYSMSHTNPARAYFDIMLDNSGKITVEMGDETCLFDLSTDSSYNDGEWHLVKIEFYGDAVDPTMNIYVDGILEGSITKWLCPMLDEDFLSAKVGRDSNDASDYFDGVIDFVKIYKNYIPTDPNPIIKNISISPPMQFQYKNVNISAEIFSFYSDIDEVFLKLIFPDDSTDNFSIKQNNTGDIYYCNKTYDQIGIHRFFLRATDIIGYSSISSEYSFFICLVSFSAR